MNAQRGHEDRDRGVNVGVGEDGVERGAVVGGGGRGDHVDGIAQARFRRKQRLQPFDRLRGQVHELEPLRLERIGDQNAGAAGIREHRGTPGARQRGAVERHRHVEQLFHGAGTEHAGLREQRVDGRVARGQGARVGGRRPGADRGASGFHRDDRLPLRDARRDFQEAPRITEILHVHQDHGDRVVLLPLQQQVVAAHVGFVADRHELRDADAILFGVVEHTHAERARLRHERRVAERRHRRGEGGVERHGGIRVQDPHAVWTDHPHPVAADDFHQPALGRGPRFPDFLEACRNHHQPPHPFATARIRHVQHVILGHYDDCQVHGVRDGVNRRIAFDRVHRAGVRIHGEDRSREPVAQDVGEHLVADSVGASRGPDHGDRAGAQNGIEIGHGGQNRD